MLPAALEAEVAAYRSARGGGRRTGSAAGGAQPTSRAAQGCDGRRAIELEQPRINDKRTDDETGERVFSSSIIPPWCPKRPVDG
jgi:hypothetical protein